MENTQNQVNQHDVNGCHTLIKHDFSNLRWTEEGKFAMTVNTLENLSDQESGSFRVSLYQIEFDKTTNRWAPIPRTSFELGKLSPGEGITGKDMYFDYDSDVWESIGKQWCMYFQLEEVLGPEKWVPRLPIFMSAWTLLPEDYSMIGNAILSVKGVSKKLQESGLQLNNELSFEQIGGDSLDKVDILMAVEKSIGVNIPDEAVDKINTVGNLVTFVETNIHREIWEILSNPQN